MLACLEKLNSNKHNISTDFLISDLDVKSLNVYNEQAVSCPKHFMAINDYSQKLIYTGKNKY